MEGEDKLPYWHITSSSQDCTHCVIFKTPQCFFCISAGGSLRAALWLAAPAGRPTTRSLLAASWVWLKTARISRRHLYISFQNAHTYLLNHVTASAYLHWYILCRESLIDGYYQGSIYNTDHISFNFFYVLECYTWGDFSVSKFGKSCTKQSYDSIESAALVQYWVSSKLADQKVSRNGVD